MTHQYFESNAISGIPSKVYAYLNSAQSVKSRVLSEPSNMTMITLLRYTYAVRMIVPTMRFSRKCSGESLAAVLCAAQEDI